MDLAADMMGDQARNPLAVGRRPGQPRIDQPGVEAVDPDPVVAVEHDLGKEHGRLQRKAPSTHPATQGRMLGLRGEGEAKLETVIAR